MMQPLLVRNFRPAAYRPAYRPMPYASVRPELAARKRLGENPELGTSLIIAGAGVGGFFLSGALPVPWDMVGKGLSAVAVGYALYRAVSVPSQSAGSQTESGAKLGPTTAIAKKEDFDTIQGSFITPKMYSTISYSFFTGKYPVQVLISYPQAETEAGRIAQRAVPLTLLLEAVEQPFYYWGTAGDKTSGIVASVPLSLSPGAQMPIDFNPETLVSTNVFSRPAIQTTLNLYKVRSGMVGERQKLATVSFSIK